MSTLLSFEKSPLPQIAQALGKVLRIWLEEKRNKMLFVEGRMDPAHALSVELVAAETGRSSAPFSAPGGANRAEKALDFLRQVRRPFRQIA